MSAGNPEQPRLDGGGVVASAVTDAPSDGGRGESCAPANIRGHGTQHHRPRPPRGGRDLPDHGRRRPVDPRRDLRTRRRWCSLDDLAAQATRRDLADRDRVSGVR
jgi:hypothetical protein